MPARGTGRARCTHVRVRLVRERTVEYEFPVDGPGRAAGLARQILHDEDREVFVCIHLSNKLDAVSFETVAVGTLNSVLVHPREVFKGALLASAAGVVVAHSHPSGHPDPSDEDLALTRQLLAAGELLGVPLHDHLIVAGDKWLSLRESGHLSPWVAEARR